MTSDRPEGRTGTRRRTTAETDIAIAIDLDGAGTVEVSTGLPVISSTNCVGGDVVVDYLNGFVIPAGDAEALAERIVWFSEHRSELEEMGLAARETALFYTWQRWSYSKPTAIGCCARLPSHIWRKSCKLNRCANWSLDHPGHISW